MNRPTLFDSPSCTPVRANMNCGRCSGSCIPMLQLLWRLRFLSVAAALAAAFRCVTAALAASFQCVTAALAATPRCFECLTAALTAAPRCITACQSQPGFDINPWYIGGPDLSCQPIYRSESHLCCHVQILYIFMIFVYLYDFRLLLNSTLL